MIQDYLSDQGRLPGPATIIVSLLLMLAGCGDDALPSFGAVTSTVGVLPQSRQIQGRDGGCSGLVWGRSVWTFGDTVLDIPDEQGANWHHNSFSVTDDLDGSNNITSFEERFDGAGAPRPFIDSTAAEETFNEAHRGEPCQLAPCGARWAVWPGAPLWDGPRNRALIFYGLIYAEPGAFNFRGVGASVAIWDFAVQPERPTLPAPPVPAHPTLLFAADEPSWGTAAVMDGDMLYVFACDGDPFGPPCSLARVSPADVLERGAWRFWDGRAWSSAMDRRVSLFDGAPTVTVAFNRHLGAWTAIYARPLTRDVVIRTAPALTGPWSPPRLLFVADKPEGGGAYDVNWHGEYDQAGGKVLYLTYSRSTGVGWFGSEFVLEQVALP